MSSKGGLIKKIRGSILVGLSGFLLIYLILGFWTDPEKKYFWIVDVIIVLAGLIFWLLFFSQFILPVRGISERIEAIKRLYYYIMGEHGPAIFIENGEARRSEARNVRKGPGVIWLDSASAAVLRTATSFVGAKGPGLVFTKRNEFIAATIDLHMLRQTIGPLESDQPFKVTKDMVEYDVVQNRRWETSGLTRDGIEVIPTFSLQYKLDAAENEGGTPLGFNPDSAYRAARDSLPSGSSSNGPIWNPIIAKMAVDVWRDYLRKYKLDELFEVSEGSDQTALQMILKHINDHLTKEETDELDEFGKPKEKTDKLDEFGKPTKITIPCTEYQKIKQMGWRVASVNIKRMTFSDDIEERLVSQWTTTWLKNAQKEREQFERNLRVKEIIGQREALKEYAISASYEVAEGNPQTKTQALELLIHSLFKGIVRNSTLIRYMNTEPRDLSEITRWLHDRRGTRDDIS